MNSFISRWDMSHSISIENLYSFGCKFNSRKYADQEAKRLKIEIPRSIVGAVGKRKAEFVAGRFCARKCMEYYGVASKNIPIGGHREPIWPDGFLGSITHSHNRAICVFGSTDEYRGVGVDIETIFPERLAQSVKNQILFGDELNFTGNTTLRKNTLVSLAFSAKESLFKAIFPSVRKYFGFESAELSEIDMANSELSLTLTSNLSDVFRKGQVYRCHFRFIEKQVVTLLVIGNG